MGDPTGYLDEGKGLPWITMDGCAKINVGACTGAAAVDYALLRSPVTRGYQQCAAFAVRAPLVT